MTAARVCAAAAEGVLVGVQAASLSRVILRAVVPQPPPPPPPQPASQQQQKQQQQQQPPSSTPSSAAAAASAPVAVAVLPSYQPRHPRSRLALFALAAEMIGAVPLQCLRPCAPTTATPTPTYSARVVSDSVAAAASGVSVTATAAAPLGTTVQTILCAAGRWNDARLWARAAGTLVNANDRRKHPQTAAETVVGVRVFSGNERKVILKTLPSFGFRV